MGCKLFLLIYSAVFWAQEESYLPLFLGNQSSILLLVVSYFGENVEETGSHLLIRQHPENKDYEVEIGSILVFSGMPSETCSK